MFSLRRKHNLSTTQQLHNAVQVAIEPLENRQLLSSSCVGGGGSNGGFGGGFWGGPGGASTNTIAFSLAPTAVQTGLDALASADNLTAPTATTIVDLGNTDGVETYSVTIDGTGTVSTLTVDPSGDAVNAPTHTTTTWATLNGTGTGSNSAPATEIIKIATALDLTAPVSTDTVDIDTTSAGTVTYSIQLNSANTSTGTTWGGNFCSNISVDSAGNPVGAQQLPFSVFSTTIQNAINANKPTGATLLASTSTKTVNVLTADGVTTYSTNFVTSGTTTTVTVNSAGALTNMPNGKFTTFSALPTSLQTELQTLATADGVTATIAPTQSVIKLTESNGTVLYTVSLDKSANSSSGSTYSFNVTLTVDSNGNPTTLPNSGLGFGDQGFGGPGIDPGFDGQSYGSYDGYGQGSDGNASNSSTGTTTNASTGTIAVPTTGSATADAEVAASLGTYSLPASLLTSLTSLEKQFGSVGKYLVEFAITKVDAAVTSDVVGIVADASKLSTDTKALTKAQKKTLNADDKAIASAIKAVNATLTVQDKQLKTDAATFLAKFKADLKVINKNKKNATALAEAKAHLTFDEAAAYSTLSADVTSVETSIEASSSVTTARAKLITDLPTIAADQTAIVTGANQLVSDIDSQLATG